MSVLKLIRPRVLAAIKIASPAAGEIATVADCAYTNSWISAKSNAPLPFGDIQVRGLLQAAKRLKLDPHQFAAAVIEHLDLGDIGTAKVDGPGFVNIRLNDSYLENRLQEVFWKGDERYGVEEVKQRVIIDYSSPNLAKEMHVGHLRSTIIGDALHRIHRFVGSEVIAQNHVGDWGTQFGMLIAHVNDAETHVDLDQLQGLEQLYVQAKVRFDAEPEFKERARDNVVKLQAGDPEMKEQWLKIVDVSLRHAQKIYDTLDTLLTRNDVCGESFYNDDLPKVVEDLTACGLLVVDGGAKVVFTPEFAKDFGKNKPVFMVQKSGDGFGYAATDLGAIRYRVRTLKGDRLLYVIDNRQSLHLRQLFDVASRAGFLPPSVSAAHVGFGTMMGRDKKPFKTRDGGTIKLAELIAEAQERAYVLAKKKDATRTKGDPFTEAELKDIGNKVGVGAIKYADLSKHRDKDYMFDFDLMLQFEGNTAPYLMYAYTRARSVARGAAATAADVAASTTVESLTATISTATLAPSTSLSPSSTPTPQAVKLAHHAEHNLAVTLLQFPDELNTVLDTSLTHHLCTYLYRLAQAYTQFYSVCPVLRAPDQETRDSRLALCDATAQMLKTGLGLLGISVLEVM
ncbi:arginine---tRNA ligase [Powellomyces hirtus]|uniref:arginine--tRNA ligase n=1 Tax=Powellomyces hirtus TaxID=109895 RepID=A0A507DV95_9FUNG|nr:arginine---tRNA ligase [Powellomyces hirtus]